MKLWLNHPALWERMQDDCFQLIRGVGNPYAATLYLRTRAERISVMLLLHLTLILQKPMSVHTQWVTTPCVSVRVRWSGTGSYISLLSVTLCNKRAFLSSLRPTHERTHTHTPSLFQCDTLTQTHKHKKREILLCLTFSKLPGQQQAHTNTFDTCSSIWVNCSKEHCSGLSHPSPPMKKNV